MSPMKVSRKKVNIIVPKTIQKDFRDIYPYKHV